MQLFEMREFDAHERIVYGADEASGLRAVIGIHSTALGPATGGCRMLPYASTYAATVDVLRLSRGASYQNAMAGLPLGGGKAVIIGDSRKDKTPQLFQAFGDLVDSLNGEFITRKDVGTTASDMRHVARNTRHVSALNNFDTALSTATGVHLGIVTAAKFQLGRSDLEGLTVAVQGLGAVGYHLCRLLSADGAVLRVADTQQAAAERVRDEFNAIIVPVATVLFEDVEVVAPCAMGAVLHNLSIPRIKAGIVAGAANNQLADEREGLSLHEAEILFAPDYVINAGGAISIAREFFGSSAPFLDSADDDILAISERLLEIFERSRSENLPTNAIADRMARSKLKAARASTSATSKLAAHDQ